MIERIKAQLAAHDAVLIAHYYTDPAIQALAEATGGCVADSLEMARFGRDAKAQTLIVAGVRFMGETAKILSPHKRVLMADLAATCSLDLSCPIDEFSNFCDQHPDRTVVVYANTSAAVKARADYVVTSAIGVEMVRMLHQQGHAIIWGPDRHLGAYIQAQTGADMLLWQGHCIVHDEFKAFELQQLKLKHPNAKVLVHPEACEAVIQEADFVGSTAQIIKAAKHMDASTLIVATDQGIFYKLAQAVPDKTLIIAPTAGNSATCKSCALCPWMAMNTLEKIEAVLTTFAHEITVDAAIATQAKRSIDRMLQFAEERKVNLQAQSNPQQYTALFQNIGPA